VRKRNVSSFAVVANSHPFCQKGQSCFDRGYLDARPYALWKDSATCALRIYFSVALLKIFTEKKREKALRIFGFVL
jgi:hypothetical protein